MEVKEEASDEIEEGKIIRQSPTAGQKLEKGETVIIVVSTGKEDVSVPGVIGLTKDDAISKLSAQNLKYSITSYEYSDKYAEGYVIYQNYGSGEKVPPETVINIKISKGPEPKEEQKPPVDDSSTNPTDPPAATPETPEQSGDTGATE